VSLDKKKQVEVLLEKKTGIAHLLLSTAHSFGARHWMTFLSVN